MPPALLAPGAAGSAARSPPSRRRRSERRSGARAGRLWPGGACSGLAQLARHPSPPGSWRPPIAVCSPRPCHGECAICGEALPQLPAASPGASLDRGFSGWGARPCAGTTSRPRVSPPFCTQPALSLLCHHRTPGPSLQQFRLV